MRYRTISPYTEILAVQENELQQTVAQNLELIIDGIVGASTGVVKGLSASIISPTGRTVNITTGAICDGLGKFFELLSGTILTFPSTSGTYTIYTQQAYDVSDNAVSGWVLIDVNNDIEEYQEHSTRTYDGINLNFYDNTTGTVITNRQDIWEVVVSGNSVTQINDIRSYITINNILSNSLQNFYINDTNFAFESNKITGTVLKNDNNKLISFHSNIDNSFSGGIGYKVDNGINPNTTGIIGIVDSNIGYKISNTSGSGIVINGNNNLDKAIIINNSKENIILNLSNASSGIIINGSDNNDKGITIKNSSTGIDIEGKKAINISSLYLSGTALTKTLMHGIGIANQIVLSGDTEYNATGILIQTDYQNGLGVKFNRYSTGKYFDKAIEINDSNKGILINNITGTSGIVINGSNDNDYGLILNNVANGYSTTSRNAGYTAYTMGDTIDPILVNTSFSSIIDEQGVGNKVLFNSNVINGIGLYIGSSATSNLAVTGIVISGNASNIINRGIQLIDCATGILIDKAVYSNGAIKITNSNIEIKDTISIASAYLNINNTLNIGNFGITYKHDLAKLEVRSAFTNHVGLLVQEGINQPCLRVSSRNYSIMLQGFENVADKTIFPSKSVFHTDRTSFTNRESGLQVVYDVSLDRYRLLFYDGYEWRIVPFLTTISDAGANGNIIVTGDSGSSNFALNY